jgi:phosphatidylserine/phosphatidylglycerophosphate/cardiolipin synthase-like enzyme
MRPIELDLVLDGERSPEAGAAALVDFLGSARTAIHAAIYDFQARSGPTAVIADALEHAAARGLEVRVCFDLDVPKRASSPRPPVAPPAEIDGLDVPTRGVVGDGSLMHHKYVVVDRGLVWTGSTNWTADAFGREENVVVRLESPEIAAAFEANFAELWDGGRVDGTGGSEAPVDVGGSPVGCAFSPAGPSLAHMVAEAIGGARRRLRILSPVVTAGSILGTLAEAAGNERFDLSGAYDLTQMDEVVGQWREVPHNHWKIGAWEAIRPRLSGKRSTPYGEGSVHDYMHAKVVVADDRVVAGSYNCSKGGEENAENLVTIASRPIADEVADFANRVAARYRVQESSAPRPDDRMVEPGRTTPGRRRAGK